ncbi:MAG: hypothetical protein PHF76_11410 [Bacteroidales bacterium]|nr:hypothetical protein [Bacteroidales bacterium]
MSRKVTELQRVVRVFSQAVNRKTIPPKEWEIIGRQYLNLKRKGFTEAQVIYAIKYTARTIPTFNKFGLLSWTIDRAVKEMQKLKLDEEATIAIDVKPNRRTNNIQQDALLDVNAGVVEHNAAPASPSPSSKSEKPDWMKTDLESLVVNVDVDTDTSV